jgi:alpha-L-fucosidase 2
MENKLWYTTPPAEWMEGLPIGNGRLAAMVWGDENRDILSLNHEWLWRGTNRNRDNAPAAQHLEEVRDCLRQGNFFRATSLANVYFGGLTGVSGLSHRVDAYQPAGDLINTLDGYQGFERRELDIVGAVASAQRRTAGGTVHSQFLAHPVFNLILCRWSAGEPFTATLRYTRTTDPDAVENC